MVQIHPGIPIHKSLMEYTIGYLDNTDVRSSDDYSLTPDDVLYRERYKDIYDYEADEQTETIRRRVSD